MRSFFITLLCASALLAQEPVTPTPERVGPRPGDSWSGYSILISFEAGYRFVDRSGSDANYRSAVNFGNGIRLFGSSLQVDSKSGRGTFFDHAFLTTQGLGGDPYESSSF